MSKLNSIVRRVLLEADAQGQTPPSDPQASAPAAQPKIKAAAKAVKNAISPNSFVDPSAYVENSSIGYDGATVDDVMKSRKMYGTESAQQLAFKRVNGIQWDDPRVKHQAPSQSDIDEVEEEILRVSFLFISCIGPYPILLHVHVHLLDVISHRYL